MTLPRHTILLLTFLVLASTTFAAEPAVLIARGKYSEALEALKDAKTPQDLANRCTAKYKLADYAGAAADCERAVKLEPKLRAAVKAQTSDAYYRLGTNEHLYQAVRWDRDNPLPYIELGRRALAQKDAKTALRYLDRAVLADPSRAEAFELRASAAESLGRPAQARRDRERAARLAK